MAYPFYLLITLVATPFPLILTAIHLLLHVLVTVLYPVTATFRVLGRTFILAPLGVVSRIIAIFYPVYVFIGGIIGTGCVLGLGAWWIGKFTLDMLFGSRSKKTKDTKRNKAPASNHTRGRSDKSRSNASPSAAHGQGQEHSGSRSKRDRSKALSPPTEEERERLFTPQVKSMPVMLEDDDQSEEDYGHFGRDDRGVDRKRQQHRSSILRTSQDREAAVVGLRKRGQRDMWNERR